MVRAAAWWDKLGTSPVARAIGVFALVIALWLQLCAQEAAGLAFQKWKFLGPQKVHRPNSFKPRNVLANLFSALLSLSLPLHVIGHPTA